MIFGEKGGDNDDQYLQLQRADLDARMRDLYPTLGCNSAHILRRGAIPSGILTQLQPCSLWYATHTFALMIMEEKGDDFSHLLFFNHHHHHHHHHCQDEDHDKKLGVGTP